ncbi:MAG: hypothetical protein E6R03_16200 [Hyphomicrobiaceae bacterium]|nr:MAG: hypothetical protein E6R03_16200 [Hyphomicrobiaceae bacterium]
MGAATATGPASSALLLTQPGSGAGRRRKAPDAPTPPVAAPAFDLSTEDTVTELPCPYTGKPVTLRCVGPTKLWMGLGPFYTTNPFPTKRQLIWHLLQRPGVLPAFTSLPQVSVREIERPIPAELLPDADRQTKDDQIQDKVDESIEAQGKRLGLLR